jgi:hypothetical protein
LNGKNFTVFVFILLLIYLMFFMLQTTEMQSAAVFKSRLNELLGKHYSDRISVRVKAAFEMKVKEGESSYRLLKRA